MLGHASITITRDVYGHLVEGDHRATAQLADIGVKSVPVLSVVGGRFQACRDPADESRATGRSNLCNSQVDEATEGVRIMMCYDTYRLCQIERPKSPAEARHADQQAARLASAVSSLFRGIARPTRAVWGVSRPRRVVCPARPD
jgi:hypothetical protein